MKISFLAAAIFMTFAATAQDSVQTINSTNPLTISGYVEGYYSYDFNQPSNNTVRIFYTISTGTMSLPLIWDLLRLPM